LAACFFVAVVAVLVVGPEEPPPTTRSTINSTISDPIAPTAIT
jgi:hypothetical protein